MSVRLSLAALVSAVTLFSAEHVLLKTGFRITAEKVEKRDGSYYLHTAGGVTQVLEEQVDTIERDDYIAPPDAVIKPAQMAETAPKPKPSIAEMVTRAAIANGLPPEIVHSVARAESAYQPTAVSPKGAIGVMQLMPATAASLQADPHDPEQNIEAGTRYLRDLLIKYNGDSVKALAAYNAGPGAVDKYHGVPPYRETITYVDRVLRNYTKMVDKNKSNASARP
jgi:hypothetical protein